jgi:hypothetical protein
LLGGRKLGAVVTAPTSTEEDDRPRVSYGKYA